VCWGHTCQDLNHDWEWEVCDGSLLSGAWLHVLSGSNLHVK
jgi:hypothetical protein